MTTDNLPVVSTEAGRWPTTREGQDMLDHSVQYVPEDAGRRVVAEKIAAIESEARAAVLREVAEAVRALPGLDPAYNGHYHAGYAACRTAVLDRLAILTEATGASE